MGFEQFYTMFLVHILYLHASAEAATTTTEATAASEATATATAEAATTSATATAHAWATEATLTSATTTKDVQAINQVKHAIAGNGVILCITTHGSRNGAADGALLVQDIIQLE